MKKTILNFMTSKENGLIIADMPTGFGKTYNCVQAMYEYIYEENGTKKQFYTTTLKKNLPIEDLKKVYKKNKNKNFDKDVLVIKSNYDCIFDNFLDVNVPVKFRNDIYDKLEKNLKFLKNKELKFENYLLDMKLEAEKTVKELEGEFRSHILKIIKKNLPKNKDKIIKALKYNDDYKWIAKIYPTVFMDEYKIYLLTLDKFLLKNTVLVKPSYYFISDEITDNSIIFIDEFDSGKETVERSLINRALSSKNDYIKLFLKIYNSFESHVFTNELITLSNNITNEKYKLDSLKIEAERIFNEFKLEYNYKTVENSIDRKQSFLFNDSSYHTMLRNSTDYIRAAFNKENKKVNIYFEKKKEYYKNRKEDDIIIYSLVRNIASFLNKFRLMVLTLSNKYSNHINNIRKEDEDAFTVENAMKTIYREFSFSDDEIRIIMDEICTDFVLKENIDNDIPDMTFYNNGFKYFEFEDSDEHLNETVFSYINIFNTPEKIILYLSNKAKIIGISATGSIKTVTGNYDLDYLKEKLKDQFNYIPNEVYQKIKDDLEKDWVHYRDGKIKIHTEILNFNQRKFRVEQRLEKLFNDRKKANLYARKLDLLVKNQEIGEYILDRYCSIFKAIREFIIHDDIKSFLCLNMILPKENKHNFDLNIFRDVMNELLELNNKYKENISIEVLESYNFEENKANILSKLENGEKVFIMSSYKTIGAGQNLQYKFKNKRGFVQIGSDVSKDDSRTKEKDIDAIFLGDITNIAVNIYNEDGLDKKDLLKYFFQIEYLYENDDINYSTLDNLIKLGFRKYSKSPEDNGYYKYLRDSKNIKRQATRDVVQAIGRICRTYIKNKNIYIYTVEELAKKIDVSCLKYKILNPETQAFIKMINDIAYTCDKQDQNIINKAEKKSDRAKGFIMKMLSRGWDKSSIDLWKKLRKIVMKYPTANEEIYNKEQIVKQLYINSDKELNKYLYVQKGDFSNVLVNFDDDKYVFAIKNHYEAREISEVSDKNARLSTILKYPGLKDYFENNGYATEFTLNKYILPPILFNNIYKGALGEIAGKFILERELGMHLKEIDDESKFEYFDFEISKDVYIDFKNWKQTYAQDKDREAYKKEILNKLNKIGGKRVYIINILRKQDFSGDTENDKKIIEIPALLDEEGNIRKESLDLLKGEIYDDKNK